MPGRARRLVSRRVGRLSNGDGKIAVRRGRGDVWTPAIKQPDARSKRRTVIAHRNYVDAEQVTIEIPNRRPIMIATGAPRRAARGSMHTSGVSDRRSVVPNIAWSHEGSKPARRYRWSVTDLYTGYRRTQSQFRPGAPESRINMPGARSARWRRRMSIIRGAGHRRFSSMWKRDVLSVELGGRRHDLVVE